MARKARQRISYVIPLPEKAGTGSRGGHRLGVNSLALDPANRILYSGGRDGAICTWDLNIDPSKHHSLPDFDAKPASYPATTLHQQVQAHTNWINDVVLAQSHQALVSASSDLTVKLWRPAGSDHDRPHTIGLHTDYAKRLAVPSSTSDWVASGGLDKKINVWSLDGAGQRMSIDVAAGETGLGYHKSGVYALAATDNIIATGGPLKTVKVWDTRTGKRTTQLVGHTDMIRDILISQDGSTIMSASSDGTIKVWSIAAGRCMHTLTMHDTYVWSLFSNHPNLSVFYSADGNGLVAKTDATNAADFDSAISIAVCQEHEAVLKIVAAGDCLWTTTTRSSINRWRDVRTDNLELDSYEWHNAPGHRSSIATQIARHPSPPSKRDALQSLPADSTASIAPKRKVPLKHALRVSNAAPPLLHMDSDHSPHSNRRGTIDSHKAPELPTMQPIRNHPDFSTEGQNGLFKHVMLSDRIRALTSDTAGEVVMWDLLKCVPIRSYGQRQLDDVKDEETMAATFIANWCSVDTQTGRLAVTLEENTCFDAETYADELELDQDFTFKEDTRINLGKWALRYLFAHLIDEEIRRDADCRKELLSLHEGQKSLRENAPLSIQLPPAQLQSWSADAAPPTPGFTLRPVSNGANKVPSTPGFSIGLATPALMSPAKVTAAAGTLTPIADKEGAEMALSTRESGEKTGDYFSTSRIPTADVSSPGGASAAASAVAAAATSGEGFVAEPSTPTADSSLKDAQSPTSGKEGLFGKKFRMPGMNMGAMGMSFSGMKKLGRTPTNDKANIATSEEKDDNDGKANKIGQDRPTIEDNFYGLIQRIRLAYEESLRHQIQSQQARENGVPVPGGPIELPTALTPSAPDETPVLLPPVSTTILIQEDRPDAGGVADLFEGLVGDLGHSATCDALEKAAPTWLGEVLLKNRVPPKDIVKTSFTLEPWGGLLPRVSYEEPASASAGSASSGSNRLNANRMLRARKILAYVAERIEPQPASTLAIRASDRSRGKGENGAETDEPMLKPEDYLELYCQDKLVPPTMTLYTIRTQLWKGPGDVVLQYKANGRKEIRIATMPSQSSSIFPPKAELGSQSQKERGSAKETAGGEKEE